MKIYFACSITGGRQDEAVYRQIVQALLDAGHEVPTAANAGIPGHGSPEPELEPAVVYRRDIGWIDESAALVAEVSTPSHGVGYEIAYALERGKPVLCLFQRGAKVSKMITGNNRPGLQVADYADALEAIQLLRGFLARLG